MIVYNLKLPIGGGGLVPEFLADHQAIESTVEDSNANPAKGRTENIGAVTR